jgi:hypothetical protein
MYVFNCFIIGILIAETSYLNNIEKIRGKRLPCLLVILFNLDLIFSTENYTIIYPIHYFFSSKKLFKIWVPIAWIWAKMRTYIYYGKLMKIPVTFTAVHKIKSSCFIIKMRESSKIYYTLWMYTDEIWLKKITNLVFSQSVK